MSLGWTSTSNHFEGYHCFLEFSLCLCSVVSDSFATPLTVVCQGPLSIEISRQEYWSELPFPSLGDHLNPGIELASLASHALAGRFFATTPSGKPSPEFSLDELLLEKMDTVMEGMCRVSRGGRTFSSISLCFSKHCVWTWSPLNSIKSL